ncbi:MULTISPECIES: hypothetical protein [Mycobacteriaceae]|uniref:Uncharacterized protein n=2 Tax=Mycolicibacterium TaxID=1866885 RepID=A0A178LJR3_MYCIR|nr:MULTISPECIES: hypothetical protein [Mycobacteriaceae]OAN31070.1 hypothetical protein A4X20_29345 [Mycolicibacterium iranicum]OPX08289.1 hypothetical protein B1790_19990 [Mycobacterium sp. AT1]TQR87990.1 hypothetical protein D8S82_02645 [Mycolicibacterium hodleri]
MTALRTSVRPLLAWPRRRWATAGAAAVATIVFIGVPTDLIDTPLFSREVAPTWWSWPVLLLTATLTGLLVATYVATPTGTGPDRSASRAGGVGGLLSFFAVGCPVCNKLVLLAVGTSGALRWFQPVQPILSVAGLLLLGWALRVRLRTEQSCRVPQRARS